nr:immunoglobulin heavy chain junction region [Macaca mulatta]
CVRDRPLQMGIIYFDYW